MQWLTNINSIAFIMRAIDILAVLGLIYLMLSLSNDRRTLLMVRGIIFLLIASVLSDRLGFRLLNFVLDKLLIGTAVAMAVILQPELRRFLERLGRGDLLSLVQPTTNRRSPIEADSVIEEINDAVIELSQNRTGALMIIETGEPIDDRDFSVPGVKLNALLSKELLHTIFQTSTLLHDGAILIREDRILAAGVILPISERAASREIGTRHRAAMGITDRVRNCFCIVVSEETGSIAIAENGILDRPITSSRLREILETKLGNYRPTPLGRTVPKFNWLLSNLNLKNMVSRKSSEKK
ncbi:TIGR00159 family protein [Pseudanabaena sp. FACHB-1998]|uniref:diadenylate cyclase CdaA n=1 Tax=Pseudanabaena sp. FACHB-1998 TaxID=2692858 RepID=UPI00167FFADF|nr:diadenylate cyclase CdaA [Pseudanabaena sp. FACHB-1998]MBD2177672.1 TIGR00159 family protein [Pseudanabaena sp. FACHB-1998]